jgi:putative cell wall-binding protein
MRWFRRLPALLILLALSTGLIGVPASSASASTPPSGATVLVMASESGDYIGGGQFQYYGEADGTFSGAVGGAVSIHFNTPGYTHWWNIEVSGPNGRRLEPGPYEGATRSAFRGPTEPGIDVSGDGRGCNQITGRFDLLELEYDNDGTLLRFAADIEQHCEGGPAALWVAVRYHASDVFAPPADNDADGVYNTIDLCPNAADPAQGDGDLDGIGDACDPDFQNTWLRFDSDSGDWIGKGLYRTWHPTDGAFSVTGSAGEVSVAFDGGQTWWDLQFAAPAGQTLKVGNYEGATRAPFREGSAPGIDVGGTGAGCNTIKGRFEVLDLELAPDGQVERFSADFEQHCEGGTAALRGSIRYDEAPVTRRLAGADRIATAIEASKDQFADGKAGAVVLSRSDAYADALAGTPLAAELDAPILLAPTAQLDPRTLGEIRRVLPAGGEIHLLGGSSAISPTIASQLAHEGYILFRHAGPDRYATAVAVAKAVGTPAQVLLVTGLDFPDGLTAGAAAAHVGGVVLLTDGATMPAVTKAYLAAHPDVPVTAIGGPAASAAPAAEAIVGVDRYDTAVAVARKLFPFTLGSVNLASGEGFADALAGGAHAARDDAPLLLTSRGTVPEVVAQLLRARLRDELVLLGGPSAIRTPALDI